MTAVTGHAAARALLARERQRGCRASAYLFAGPQGVGKRRVAEWFLQSLACTGAEPRPCGTCAACTAWAQANYRDFHVLSRMEAVNLSEAEALDEGKVRHEISIESVGWLQRTLTVCAEHDAGHLVIIDEAEYLNRHSANALLKTLEEPPERPAIIMVTDSLQAMLPTIRSRCRTVRFGRLTVEETAQVLAAPGVRPSAADLLLAEGRPGRLRALLAGDDADQRAGARSALLRHLAAGEPPWWEMAGLWKLTSAKKEEGGAARARAAARDLLEMVLLWRRLVLQVSVGGAVPRALAEWEGGLRAAAQRPRRELEEQVLHTAQWLARMENYTNAGATAEAVLLA